MVSICLRNRAVGQRNHPAERKLSDMADAVARVLRMQKGRCWWWMCARGISPSTF
jgi:hypothetical protein